MADDIAFMPATRLLALYRGRQLSPVEVIEHTLRRLETYEGAINAFVLYDPETGLAMARASEARWRKGDPQGLLDGVPVALKDTLLTRGWPRLLGSRTIDPNQAWDARKEQWLLSGEIVKTTNISCTAEAQDDGRWVTTVSALVFCG